MPTAETWITKLNLSPHPEGGYFREIYRSAEIISKGLPNRYSGGRNFCTSIYYLLMSGQCSSFHKIQSDETWHFYYGSPLELHIIHPNKKHELIFLGHDIENGEILQHTVPHGSWMGATPKEINSYSITGATVSPGFDFNDFELGKRNELIKLYPQHESIINKLALE